MGLEKGSMLLGVSHDSVSLIARMEEDKGVDVFPGIITHVPSFPG